MKVIEVGNVTKRIKCSRCFSKLEYGPADVRIVNNDDAILAKQVILLVAFILSNFYAININEICKGIEGRHTGLCFLCEPDFISTE